MTAIPRVDEEQWERLGFFSRWLIATRAAVLVMTLIAAAIAGLLAWRDGQFDPVLWALVTLGLVFAHATNNLVNDFTDHITGVDKGNYFRTQYGTQPLEQGLMSKKELLAYAAATGAVALAAGGYLTWVRGELTLLLMAIGVIFVLFYTWPLKYIGLGEPAVLLVWGPLMVGGGYYVITGTLTPEVVVASLPFALGATSVLFGKHIDKLEADKKKGIRTLPVLLGERLARGITIVMLVSQYLLVAYLVLIGFFSFVVGIVALALPTLWLVAKNYRSPKPESPPAELPEGVWPLWFVALAFHHTRRFGGLYVLGIVLDVLLRHL